MFPALILTENMLWYTYLFFFYGKYAIPLSVSVLCLLLVAARHDLKVHLQEGRDHIS
jgi:hypothetical protein